MPTTKQDTYKRESIFEQKEKIEEIEEIKIGDRVGLVLTRGYSSFELFNILMLGYQVVVLTVSFSGSFSRGFKFAESSFHVFHIAGDTGYSGEDFGDVRGVVGGPCRGC